MRFDGDDHLSSNDRKRWSLCYATLEKFGCLTMFRVRGPYAQHRVSEQLWYFVPGEHPRAAEVREYLENELRHEARAPTEIEGEWCYGTDVRVLYFGGLDGYVDYERMAELTEPLIENFMQALKTRVSKTN